MKLNAIKQENETALTFCVILQTNKCTIPLKIFGKKSRFEETLRAKFQSNIDSRGKVAQQLYKRVFYNYFLTDSAFITLFHDRPLP